VPDENGAGYARRFPLATGKKRPVQPALRTLGQPKHGYTHRADFLNYVVERLDDAYRGATNWRQGKELVELELDAIKNEVKSGAIFKTLGFL